MNILIIGLGSIGQRHLRNLKLVEPNSNFFAIRKKNNVPLLNNLNKVLKSLNKGSRQESLNQTLIFLSRIGRDNAL